jgi:pimeloyl-ACP methyl ester carboxylesterase
VMIEPPLGAGDDVPAVPVGFLTALDALATEQGPEAAAERFLRTVLGDAAFERMPRAYRDRATAKSAEIRADSAALIAYDPRYAELASVQTPVLLLGGDRSAPYFLPTLETLRASLPNSRLEIVKGAGHMLHAEASRRFLELVTSFADEIG